MRPALCSRCLRPLLFGDIMGSSRLLFIGYAVAAIVMIAAGFIQVIWGVAAERRALESLRELSQAA
jgi:hypothetical protein